MRTKSQSGRSSLLLPCMTIIALCLGGIEGILLPCTNSFFECGKPSVGLDLHSSRVVGGHKAQRGSWPWLVMLTWNGYPECGGAILNERFILTATHCFTLDEDLEHWRVVAGKTRTDRTEPGQKTVKIKKIIRHETFNASSDAVEDDIALLLVDEPLAFSTLIKPICLPDVSDVPRTGEACYFAGWGATQTLDDYQNRVSLNQVLLPIISDDTCSRSDWYGTAFLPETQLCAGYAEGGRDACFGDSGGPLICKTGEKWVVKGISSWGYECAVQQWPGIYTDVTKYLQWIDTNMASNYPCVDVRRPRG